MISLFTNGLKPFTRHILREAVAQNPRMSYQALKSIAQSYGDARREDKAQATPKASPYAKLHPKPPRLRRQLALWAQPDLSGEIYALPINVGSPRWASIPSPRSGYSSSSHSPGGYGDGVPRTKKLVAILRCYACKQAGQRLIECPFVTEEQRKALRSTQDKFRDLEKQLAEFTSNAQPTANTPVRTTAPTSQVMRGEKEKNAMVVVDPTACPPIQDVPGNVEL